MEPNIPRSLCLPDYSSVVSVLVLNTSLFAWPNVCVTVSVFLSLVEPVEVKRNVGGIKKFLCLRWYLQNVSMLDHFLRLWVNFWSTIFPKSYIKHNIRSSDCSTSGRRTSAIIKLIYMLGLGERRNFRKLTISKLSVTLMEHLLGGLGDRVD